MRKKYTPYLMVGAALLQSGSAMAEGLSYTYLQISDHSISAGEQGKYDIGGFVVEGSLAMDDRFFIRGAYQDGSYEQSGGDITGFSFGPGARVSIGDTTDLVISLVYQDVIYQDVQIKSTTPEAFLNGDGNGEIWELDVACRGMISNSVELSAGASYTDSKVDFDQGKEKDSTVALKVGAAFYASPALSLRVDVNADSGSAEELRLGVRFNL